MGSMRLARFIGAVLVASTAACGAGTAATLAEQSATPSPSRSSDSPFVVTVEPDPALRGEEAIVTVSGRAFGGRHLSVSSFQVEGLGGWSGGPQCAAEPSHEPALPDDAFELKVPYTWKDAGTFTVSMDLVAHCRMDDIPPHKVTVEIAVE